MRPFIKPPAVEVNLNVGLNQDRSCKSVKSVGESFNFLCA